MKKQTTKKQLRIRTQWLSGEYRPQPNDPDCNKIYSDCKNEGKNHPTCLAYTKRYRVNGKFICDPVWYRG